jgi:hypothetical protein
MNSLFAKLFVIKKPIGSPLLALEEALDVRNGI